MKEEAGDDRTSRHIDEIVPRIVEAYNKTKYPDVAGMLTNLNLRFTLGAGSDGAQQGVEYGGEWILWATKVVNPSCLMQEKADSNMVWRLKGPLLYDSDKLKDIYADKSRHEEQRQIYYAHLTVFAELHDPNLQDLARYNRLIPTSKFIPDGSKIPKHMLFGRQRLVEAFKQGRRPMLWDTYTLDLRPSLMYECPSYVRIKIQEKFIVFNLQLRDKFAIEFVQSGKTMIAGYSGFLWVLRFADYSWQLCLNNTDTKEYAVMFVKNKSNLLDCSKIPISLQFNTPYSYENLAELHTWDIKDAGFQTARQWLQVRGIDPYDLFQSKSGKAMIDEARERGREFTHEFQLLWSPNRVFYKVFDAIEAVRQAPTVLPPYIQSAANHAEQGDDEFFLGNPWHASLGPYEDETEGGQA
jgi:hypothetical protein